MSRTDVHSPSNLVTENYQYCLGYDNNPGDEGRQPLSEWARDIVAKVQETERGTWQCHHCGARLRYAAIMQHVPTGEYIAVGETCLDNRFDRASEDFHALRASAQLDREQKRIRTAVAEWVAANADLAWMDRNGPAAPEGLPYFVTDVAGKLNRYGNISEAQANAVRRIVREVAERAAQRATEAELPTVPCLVGKVTITGVVVGTKVQYSDFGAVKKLIIRDERGFKVYVTEPSSITADRGDTVRLTCTVTRSDRDESFGFGKRPTKPEVLARANGEAV